MNNAGITYTDLWYPGSDGPVHAALSEIEHSIPSAYSKKPEVMVSSEDKRMAIFLYFDCEQGSLGHYNEICLQVLKKYGLMEKRKWWLFWKRGM